MKTIHTLLLLSLFSFVVNSQNIDSLKAEIKKETGADKGIVLFQIGKFYEFKNSDSSLLYLNKSLEYIDSYEDISQTYETIGMVNFYNNDFVKTLENFKISLKYAEETKKDSLIARRFSDIGVTYDFLGAFDKSVEYYYKALNIFEKENDKTGMAKIYNNLAIITDNRGNYKEAIELYNKSLNLKNEVNSTKSEIATTYINLGSAFEKAKEYEKSLNYYRKALSIFKNSNKRNYHSLSLTNIAGVELLKHETDSATYYVEKSLKIDKQTNNKLGLLRDYRIKGNIFLEKNNPDSAIVFFNKSLFLADTLKVLAEKYRILKDLVSAYSKKNDYKNAFLFQEKLFAVNDSLNNEKTENKIETLKIVYETDKKEEKIATLEKNLHKNRIIQIITGVILLLIVLIILLIFKNKLTKTKYEADLFNQKLLRLQMNPHFIFNALASIQSFMFEKDVKKAALYLSSFSKLTRSILNNSREEFISLQEDVDTTDNYLKIQQMRFENKFDYDIIIDEEIDPEYVQVPPMLIQPFVENAVIHGFKDIDYIGQIKVEYKRKNDSIEVIVEDNGKGIDLQSEKLHKSHALSITKERLKILNNNKKRLISFQISDNEEKKGVKVIFLIPFLTQK